MVRNNAVLEDNLQMGEAPSPRTVHGPQWLRDMYLSICPEINCLDGVITAMQDACEDPKRNAPGLCKAYNMLLQEQYLLFDQQAEALLTAKHQNFMQFATASTQFAEEVRLAIKYSEMTAEARAQDAGKEMLKHVSTLAQHNADQFSRVEVWAKEQELARKWLEDQMAEREASNGKMVDQFRRDMEVWKEQAAAMKTVQEMALEEQNRFSARARRLEREALRLAQDVQRMMKSGKEMSTQELKDLRKLLRKTAKTTKCASHRDSPESPQRHHHHRRCHHGQAQRTKSSLLRLRRPCRARRRRKWHCHHHRRLHVPSHMSNVLEGPRVIAQTPRPVATIAIGVSGMVPWKVSYDIASRKG